MELTNSDAYKNKVLIIGLTVLFLIYLCRLFYMQVLDSTYIERAKGNAFREKVIHPSRGYIYDRNGEPLVCDQAIYDLMVTPKDVIDLDTFSLCRTLGISIEEARARFTEARKYSTYRASIFEKQLSPAMYGRISGELHRFRGFYTVRRTIRSYPHPIAAHVLGYVGEVNDRTIEENSYYKPGDYIGVSGIEKAYEEELRGVKGMEIVLVDVHNREQGRYKDGKYDVAAVAGTPLWTAIDYELQEFAEYLMQNKRGSIVAIEPKTGEILCYVSSPGYDPNLLVGRERSKNYVKLLSDSINKPLFNRPIMAMYPPGSTFKIANALIGQQEGVLTPGTSFPCYAGFAYAGRKLGCHNHASPLNLKQSIQHSCNAYYCYAFKAILENRKKYKTTADAYDHWVEYLHKMGFGRKLDVDLPNELKGIVKTREYYDKVFGKGHWSPYTIISLSIGQGELGATMLQMANLTATVANRGYYYLPHVVKSVGSKDAGNDRYKQKYYIGIDQRHFDAVIEGMKDVVTAGTGRRAQVPGITVAGKTGTAQNPHGRDHSVFVSFAPVENPQIAIAILVENGGWGASYGAPIAGLLTEKYIKREITNTALAESIAASNLLK